MKLISATPDLEQAVARLAAFPYVTVDTEFMRETTYWPLLCLIQIAADDCEYLIDPMAPGLDLGPFYQLMADQRVTKVFHAARQDIEIIHHNAGVIPQPLFDTQVAAMVCGFGELISYSNLVKSIVGVHIDKSSQFTDWQRRPLAPKQLTYALGDVTHLRKVYAALADNIARSGRQQWLDDELTELTSIETYATRPEDAWQRLKLRTRSKKSLAVLIEVAAWRERMAQLQNVPRGRILKDDAIYDIATQLPISAEQLSGLRTLHDGFTRSARGQDLLTVVNRALERDMKSLPAVDHGSPPSAEAGAVIELLRVLLKAKSAEHGVAPKLLATTSDLEQIAASDSADVPALKGWRRELFGEAALKLKRGELALALDKGAVIPVPAGRALSRED